MNVGFDLMSVVVTSVTIGSLGFVVFLNNRRSITTKTFFLFSLITIIWSVANYFSYQIRSPLSLWLLRGVIFLGVWHSFSFFQLAYVFPKEKIELSKQYKFIFIPLIFSVSIISLTPLVFSHVGEFSVDGRIVKVVNGPFIPLFATTVVSLIFSGLYLLFKRTFRTTGIERKQSQLILIGALLTFFLLVIFNFILPAFFDNSSFTFLGAAFISPFIALTAYAIVKYKLLDIKVIATELVTFALWMVILIDFLLAENAKARIFEGFLLAILVTFGIFLIRSVRKEVEQREYLEVVTKELAAANEKLKELDDLKTDFISIASHQLRTPLTAIKGYTSMMLEGSYGVIPEKQKGIIEKVFQSAQRLIFIVNDLLDISRIEQGRFSIAPEPIKVANVLKDVVDELQQNAKNKNLSLELAVAPEYMDVTGFADFNKIRQVFLNVIDNSIKYTDKGYVRVSVEQRPNDVLVAVKDSGIGISEASMKNLFQKFSRAKGVTKLHTDGSGLGLFIVKKIMEAHGGDVWAESEGEGKGSQFYISIPLQKG